MARPLIALFPSYDEGEGTQTVYLRYVRAVENAGGAPFVLPMTASADVARRMAEVCGGALFTGGGDLCPTRYGCCLHEGCEEPTLLRDECEFAFAEAFLKTKKPYLGVCRGIQFLNVFYGGTLYQDIALEYSGALKHRQARPYDVPSHGVALAKGGRLAQICGAEKIAVNSMHHQGLKALGRGLLAEGVSDDGLVEAVSASDRDYGIAVQWHPEHLVTRGDTASKALFESFVAAAARGL